MRRAVDQGSRTGSSRFTLVTRSALGLALALATVLGSVPAGADDLDEAKRHQAEVGRLRDELGAKLDVLGADETTLVAALDTMQANVAAGQAALAEAERAAEEARSAATLAAVDVDRVDGHLHDQRALLRDLAIDAYIGDPGSLGDVALFVGSDDAAEGAKAVYLADLEIARHDVVTADLADRASDLDTARDAADAAAVRAATAKEELGVQLAAAGRARDDQARFVASVEAELERRLSEAAGLEELDRQLAADIAREEEVLAARLRAEAEASARAVAERARADAALAAQVAPLGGGGDGEGGGQPPPSRPPSGTVVRVGGINVDATIAEPLAALLAAAAADGVTLGGGGYRDSAAQLERRAANCGTSPHDLYEKAASACSPPTARPGHSMHERGLAIDFTLDGALISTRSNRGYAWLADNAARFGLHNLPSEPWHWSTNGQ